MSHEHDQPYSQSQIVNLHIAGAAALPSPYPERGTISFEERTYEHQERHWVALIEYRVSRVQSITYVIALNRVAAIAWASDDKAIDPAEGEWWLRRDIVRRVEEDRHRSGRGIVFAPEHVPVIVVSDIATTAGQSAEYSMRPCCPDR